MRLKAISRALGCALLMCLPMLCAQEVPVVAQLMDGGGSVATAGFLHFELENCGNNFPSLASPGPSQNPWTIVRTAFDLKPNQPDGSIVGQVLANDQILCGNVASTYYQVTAMKDFDTPVSPVGGEPYVICSASAPVDMSCSNPGGTTWNPALQQPAFQPVKPGFVQIFGNPQLSQVVKQPAGTALNLFGTFNFTNGFNTGPIFFSQLAALTGLANLVYVSDATLGSNPCIGGGTGSFAFYVAGAWTCAGLSSGGSGTITGVTAGSGLSGGGVVGNIGISLLTSCSLGQTLQWNGASWVCASVGAPAGTPGLIQYGNGSVFGSDPQLSYDSIAHTITFLNAIINGTMTWANAFGLNTVIPVTPACIPGAAGTSSFGINTDGNFAYSNNGDACGDILRTGGNVISGAPIGAQTVNQPVTTSLNTNVSNNVRNVVPSFNWAQTLAVDWSATGAKTATLTPCPLGIDITNNANQPYKVYIPTTNPEVVTVTGGTCTSGGTTGTITFTTALVHSASSNQIGSASAGWQEAINDGCGTATGSAVTNPNCVIKGLPTGATANAPIIRAPIFVHASNMTLDLSGVLLNCATRSQCIFLGDNNNSNHYSNVKILGGSFESSVNADGCLVTATQRISNVVTITVGTCTTILTGDTVNINFTDSPAYWGNKGPVTVSGSSITYAQTGADIPSAATPGTIAPLVGITEDNAFPGIIDGADIHTGTGGGLFNQGFVVDNDQAATIRNTNYQPAGGLRCTAKHCASAVYSAGSTAATPVIWVDNANWSFQCAGNGLTNLANNTTRITNSVIQGFAQWGVNTSAILGSFGGTVLDNIYNEEGLGPCTQPYNFAVQPGSFASVGVLYSSGPPLEIRGGEQVNGNLPRLFVATGAQQLNYYVVPHDSVDGYGYPLLAGYGFTNGTGTPVIQWARIPASSAAATMTYDLIRWGGMGTVAANTPNFPTGAACTGGSPTACGSIVVNQAQCAGLVCTFTDDVASNTTSYAINSATFMPLLPFWPGGIVLHNTNPTSAALTPTVQIDSDAGSANFSPWISVAGNLRPTFFVRQCLVNGAGGGGGFAGGAWVQCLAGDNHGNSFKAVGATLYQNSGVSGGNALNVKGILNFPISPAASYQAQHIITFADSNPAKTIATYYSRPSNDALDTYAGFDLTGSAAPNAVPLAFGSPVSISNYIANSGDGTSYLERLTASLKTFKVPITTNSNFTFTGSGVLIYPSQARVANLYTGGNPGLIYCGTSTSCAPTQLFNAFTVSGKATLSGGTLAYSGLPFASTTWLCLSRDVTTPGTTSSMVQVTDSTHATITGTGTDVIAFECEGN